MVNTTLRRGAELQGAALAGELRRTGHDVDLVALQSAAGPSTGIPSLATSARSFRALRSLRQRARGRDVVLAYGSSTLPACAIALAGSGVPFLYRNIGDPYAWTRGFLHRLRTRLVYARADHVVALWQGAADAIADLYGVPDARLSVVPNARDASRFTPPTPGQRETARQELQLDGRSIVLYLGSLSPEKQVDRALRAIGQLPDATLVIAGDGPARPALEQQASTEGIENVQFLGSVADPITLLHASDALLLSSRTEGMPGVVIEAGLCGVPSVAPPVGSIPELIVDGTTGAIAADDSPDALATALSTVLGAAEAMGRRASAHMAAHYVWDQVTPKWADILEHVAAGRQATG